MEETYHHLAWDTDCFGFKVARIMRTTPDEIELSGILRTLREKDYRMAYWYVPVVLHETSLLARSYGGFLVDEKVTYVKKLDDTSNSTETSAYRVVPYTNTLADSSLIKLALESSEYSRFRLDPLFPKKLCDKLYKSWIINSVSKKLAWNVLVVKKRDDYLGLISLGTKDGKGNIGLAAVAKNARGKGIGRVLVAAADRHIAQRGYSHAAVVTQKQNLGACRLFESCGYSVYREENIFHFWF